jgi:hypothetical protein
MAYAKLLRLWQHADPELQVIIADVRQRTEDARTSEADE